MKDNLVRFGVAMEPSLVAELDKLAEARGSNRSELIRDMARAEVGRSALEARVPAFAAVTLVYNHHVRELSEKLTALQHDLGDQVRSTMHVHLDHEHCLEVVVMRGRSDQLKSSIERMLGTRGVIQGGAEYVAEGTLSLTTSGRRAGGVDPGEHADHAHAHPHPHAHPSADERAVSRVERAAPKVERAGKRRGPR